MGRSSRSFLAVGSCRQVNDLSSAVSEGVGMRQEAERVPLCSPTDARTAHQPKENSKRAIVVPSRAVVSLQSFVMTS